MIYVIKVIISACIIVLINVICKRSIVIGSILASIPLVSVLAITLTYLDTKNSAMVSKLTASIGWMVLPSLVFFIALPACLKLRLGFTASMIIAILATSIAYTILLLVLRKFGIDF
jgi:hypothetical protein